MMLLQPTIQTKALNMMTTMNKKNDERCSSFFLSLFVPEAGVEPARPQWTQDFKSGASTDSATQALISERKTRLELAILGTGSKVVFVFLNLLIVNTI